MNYIELFTEEHLTWGVFIIYLIFVMINRL